MVQVRLGGGDRGFYGASLPAYRAFGVVAVLLNFDEPFLYKIQLLAAADQIPPFVMIIQSELSVL